MAGTLIVAKYSSIFSSVKMNFLKKKPTYFQSQQNKTQIQRSFILFCLATGDCVLTQSPVATYGT